MNKHVDPKHPYASLSAIGEPSFADVLQAIASDERLSDDRKRHWTTSLRKVADYLDRPLPMIPARISGISRQVMALHPARLGVNGKTFANHRANARAALNWFRDRRSGPGRDAAMSTAYRDLLASIGCRHHRDLISPFLRYLSAEEIQPTDIRDEHLSAYVEYCRATKFRPLRNSSVRSLARHFNHYAETTKNWPDIELIVPAARTANEGLPWDQVPVGLRSDIEAVLKRRSRPRKSAAGRRMRGCKQSTLNLVKRKLEAAVRMAVRTGIPLEELSSLGALLHPDRSVAIIDAYWRARGEQPGNYTIELATLFLDLARSETDLNGEALARLEDMRALLEEHRRSGLTEKNMTLIRQVLATDTWTRVVALPRRILAEANAFRKTRPIKSAVSAQLAIAITLLTMAPVREQILDSGGAWVTEYRMGQEPLPAQFVKRDRTQAGLAQGVIMIQSDLKGGSLFASRAAIEYQRWLSVPYPTDQDVSRQEPKIQANLLLADGTPDEKAELLKCKPSDLPRLIVLRSKSDYAQMIHPLAPPSSPGPPSLSQLQLF